MNLGIVYCMSHDEQISAFSWDSSKRHPLFAGKRNECGRADAMLYGFTLMTRLFPLVSCWGQWLWCVKI